MSESESDNDSVETTTDNSDYINNITMNFLMNKSQHKKFISTEDPAQYERETKTYTFFEKTQK